MALAASVSVELLHLIALHAARTGVDASGVLGALGVEPDLGPGARVGAPQFAEAFDALARASKDPCFGLHLGAALPALSSGHVLASVMRNSPTVKEALERFFRYHALLTDAVVPSLAKEGAEVRVALEPRTRAARSRHHAEAVFAMIAAFLEVLPTRPVHPTHVQFSHSLADDAPAAEHRRVLGGPARFLAPTDAMWIRAVDLEERIPLADRELLAVVERFAKTLLDRQLAGDSWEAGVRAAVARQLAAGERPAVASVARALGVGSRQLQHRLHAERCTFQRILDSVRGELALRHLADGDLSLCELAFLLGFSEQSAFQRAFKRWTGTSPGDFARGARRQRAGTPAGS